MPPQSLHLHAQAASILYYPLIDMSTVTISPPLYGAAYVPFSMAAEDRFEHEFKAHPAMFLSLRQRFIVTCALSNPGCLKHNWHELSTPHPSL